MLTSILAAIPQPPTHLEMPKTAETVFNVFIFIALGVFLGLAIRQLVQGKGPVLLYCKTLMPRARKGGRRARRRALA